MKTHHLVIFLCLSLFLVGCFSAPRQFPDLEIVYQTGDPDINQLGFVDADGGEPIIWNEMAYIIRPVWSLDGTRVYGTARRYQAVISGHLMYQDQGGKWVECKQWWRNEQVALFEDAGEPQVLVADGKRIELVDMDHCLTDQIWVDLGNRGSNRIIGFSYFPEKKWLLYGLESDNLQIIKKDMATGVETLLMSGGLSPSWSPDGSQIAFVKEDGIYVMGMDGSAPRRILKRSFLIYSDFTSYPNWSSDGKWLVYHRCEQERCYPMTEYAIFKVNVASGEEQKILQGGIFPDWRKSLP